MQMLYNLRVNKKIVAVGQGYYKETYQTYYFTLYYGKALTKIFEGKVAIISSKWWVAIDMGTILFVAHDACSDYTHCTVQNFDSG